MRQGLAGVQVACETGFFAECPLVTGATYPKQTKVELKPLEEQKTMADPCFDVPKNPWCPKAKDEQPPYPVPGGPAE